MYDQRELCNEYAQVFPETPKRKIEKSGRETRLVTVSISVYTKKRKGRQAVEEVLPDLRWPLITGRQGT